MKLLSSLLRGCSKKNQLTISNFRPNGRRSQSNVATSPVSPEALDRARPFEEIPGPKPLPFLGNLHRYFPLTGEYSKKDWHLTQKRKFYQYGSLVREEIAPGINLVHLYDPKDMEVIHRHEGRNPQRDFFEAQKMMREMNPEVYSTIGLGAANGETWRRMRVRTQKPMLRPQIMKTFLPQMNVIADDLIRRIRLLRQPNHQVPLFLEELFKWALESVTYIFFTERMGCLDDNIAPDSLSQQYIRAVNKYFQFSAKVELSFLQLWRAFPSLSPSFQKLKKVHDFFYENAMAFVQTRIAALKKGELSESRDVSLMELLLEKCSPGDAGVMAVDAMSAGIDTTSLTLANALRNLAVNPEVQKKLQAEVDRIAPNGQPLSEEALDQLKYMRACIKESMRICPTVQGTARTLNKDIVLSGYRVPAQTNMTLNYNVSCAQESNFKDAHKYIPERWMDFAPQRSEESFAFVPFGFGPRMCIGRRIAELEMLTLLTKIMQNFWLEDKSDEPEIRFQLVLMIKSPLQYEFYERHSS